MRPDASLRRGAAFIAGSRARSYLGGGMHRLWSTLLVALALIMSPMAMASGALANAPAAAGHETAAPSAHCAGDEMPASGDTHAEQLSCAAACAALPALPLSSGAASATLSAPPVAAPNPALLGFEPEGETPPPRITPVI
jgi:hypothetical protein